METAMLAPGATLETLRMELSGLGASLEGDGAVCVRDVRVDSRRVSAGDLFVAREGTRTSGASFAADAVARGAGAVLADQRTTLPALGVPVLRVSDADRAIGIAAEAVWGHPARALDVIGVTGTNGKTTTTWLVAHALEALGTPTARLGTLGYACGADVDEETLTTPGADDLTRYFARARHAGAGRLVMEVSSHALAQRRVDAVGFSVAAFTNLTQDHLDYHVTMEAYGEAKARFFVEPLASAAVINVDDPFGSALAGRARTGRVLRVGRATGNDVHPEDVVVDRSGICGVVATPEGPVELDSRLTGRHNLANLLLALGVGIAVGMPAARMAVALSNVPGVPGRTERCDVSEDDLVVLVDYAHTPDALSRVLEAARGLTGRRVWCVFGCGGDRDPHKRPLMGAAVGAGCDSAIVTSDNPRSERPELIASAIEQGLAPTGTPYRVLLDRKRAIEVAIAEAQSGDVVVIAGKGHEPYQIVGTERRAFDDRAEARRALALRRGGSV